MKTHSAYFKVVTTGKLVGGVIVDTKVAGVYYLGRLFIAPGYQRQGIGSYVVEQLFAMYLDAQIRRLGTPAWNTRTPAFYEKLGFRVTEHRGNTLFINEG